MLELAGAIFDPDQTQAFCSSNKVDDPNCDPPPEIRDELAKFVQLNKTDPVVQASVKRSHLPYSDPRVKAVFANGGTRRAVYVLADQPEISATRAGRAPNRRGTHRKSACCQESDLC